jgi:hypothetical protein
MEVDLSEEAVFCVKNYTYRSRQVTGLFTMVMLEEIFSCFSIERIIKIRPRFIYPNLRL